MGILLWPRGEKPAVHAVLPPHTAEDLQLQQICDTMAFNHYYRLSVQELSQLWTSDPEVIRYRHAVLRDFADIPQLPRLLETLLDSIDTWESHTGRARGSRSADEHRVLDMWSLSFLDSCLARLEELCGGLAELPLKSEGMTLFLQRLRGITETRAFSETRRVFREDFSGYSLPSRLTVGFNLNDSLRPVSLKLLRVPEKGSKGRRMSLTPSSVATARTVVAKALSEVANSAGSYVNMQTRELRALRQDIIFYLSALKLSASWEAAGLSWCLPETADSASGTFTVQQMFNPLLVINHAPGIVCNDLEFREGGELLVLTGANQGGKTMLLQATALTQWLFQLGIMVPCRAAKLSPAEQVITVFAPTTAGTSAARAKGLLSEEAGRIAEAVERLRENSMVLLNEPLNATSPAENLYISKEVMAAFKAAGVRGIWVTHLYELASQREQMNSLIPWGSTIGSIRIIVAHDEKGTHSTYSIERGEPEFNSYASEVLRRAEQQQTR